MEGTSEDVMESASDKLRDRLRCCSCLFYFVIPIALISAWLALIPPGFWTYWWLPLVSGIIVALGFSDCLQAFDWMNGEAAFKTVVSAFASPGCLIAISFFPLVPSDLVGYLLLLLIPMMFSSGWLIFIWVEQFMVMP